MAPVTQQLAVEDRAALAWSTARQLGTFTVHQLAASQPMGLTIIRPAIRAWMHAGMVEETPVGRRRHMVYRVVSDVPRHVERPAGTPAENMWRTARKLSASSGQFSPVDLVLHSSTAATRVSDQDARAFCAMLLRAGYLRVLRKAVPGRHAAAYRLIRDSGPCPPEERRVRAVWDPNLRKWVHVPEPGA